MRQPDYTKYTLADLRQALSTVDGDKYPENKAALEDEMQMRVDSGEVEREQQELEQKRKQRERDRQHFARRARPWIGLLLMSSPVMVFTTTASVPSHMTWPAYLILGLGFAYIVAAFAAGFGLWRRLSWGYPLAITVLVLQVVHFQSDSLAFGVASPLAGFVYVTSPGAFGALFQFGASASVNLGSFNISAGDLGLPFVIQLNLFAAFLIWLLYRARQPLGDEEDHGTETGTTD